LVPVRRQQVVEHCMEQQCPATGVWRPAVRVRKNLSMVKLFFFLFYFLAPPRVFEFLLFSSSEFFSGAIPNIL
jgi:hypothetical protein